MVTVDEGEIKKAAELGDQRELGEVKETSTELKDDATKSNDSRAKLAVNGKPSKSSDNTKSDNDGWDELLQSADDLFK